MQMKRSLMDKMEASSKRKYEHLHINLTRNVQFAAVSTGLEKYRFLHQALPEVDASSIDLSVTLFGKTLRAPILLSPMTGGVKQAQRINHNLALAAQSLGIAMGVGSQRAALENHRVANTFRVRDVAPNILLFANLGAVQLNYGYGIEECRRAVEMIEADALMLHLNPLQEALQPEGQTNFSGLLRKIERVCRRLEVPVIVKEVGWGISESVARKLVNAGVAGLDVAGAGGTSWGEVERHRARSDNHSRVAKSFASWGIPTAESIQMVRRAAPATLLIASGGLRTGIDVAKAIALGADAAGIAAPLLIAADVSAQAVMENLREIIDSLRITMFCVGAANLTELKDSPHLEKIE
jgi:isopentenyl-diphosphate delta-isomerase